MSEQVTPHAAHLQDPVGTKSEDCIDCVRGERLELTRQLRSLQDELRAKREALDVRDRKITELDGELATGQKDLRKAQDTLERLTAQIEELETSPLDLAQQQRLKALRESRTVVEEIGSSNILGKAGRKVSLAGVLSTAHFITSGERDYVTTEGEFIEWHALAPRRPSPEQLVTSDGSDAGENGSHDE